MKDDIVILNPGNDMSIILLAQVGTPVRRTRLLQVSPKSFQNFDGSTDHFIADNEKTITGMVTGDNSDDLSTAKTQGIIMGLLISLGIYGGEFFTVAFAFCGCDPTFILIKFTQLLKFLERLRFVNIKFGSNLEHFWQKMTFMTYPTSKLDRIEDEFWDQRKQFTGKVAFYDLTITKDIYFMVKLFFFYCGYLAITIINGYFDKLWFSRKVIQTTMYRLCSIRKYYFVFLNIVILDSIFYGTFSLLHMNWTDPKPVYIFAVLNMLVIVSELLKMTKMAWKSDEAPLSIWILKHYNEFREFKDGKPILNMSKLKLSKISPMDHNDSVVTDLHPKIARSVYKNDEISEYRENMAKIEKVYNVESGVKISDGTELIKVLDVAGTLNRGKSNLPLLTFCLSDLSFSHDKKSKKKISRINFGIVKLHSMIYLLRLAVYMVLIVSLQFLPIFCLALICLTEIYLMFSTWSLFCKHSHLRSNYLAVHKIV